MLLLRGIDSARRGVSSVGRRGSPHHAIRRRRWIAPIPVRGRRVTTILLLQREMAAASAAPLGGRRHRGVLLVVPTNMGHTQFLELAPPDPIALVLAGPSPKSVFQKLPLELRPAVLRLAQYAIDFGLFFESTLSRSVVLLVPALVVDIDDLSLLFGPIRLRPLLDLDHPGPVFRGAGPRIGVLAGSALHDLGRDVEALGLDVDLEVAGRLAGAEFRRTTGLGVVGLRRNLHLHVVVLAVVARTILVLVAEAGRSE